MFWNRELRQSLLLMGIPGILLTALGFWMGPGCGILVLCASGGSVLAHLRTESRRYQRLADFSRQLEELLLQGKALSIAQYEEGELSVLANRIQKLALRLTETAEAVQLEKLALAEALADISHQLRTPLTAMNLTAALLSEPGLKEERRRALVWELQQLLHRTDWLVETLLKLSKLDAGTVTLARERVLVSELIDRAAGPLAVSMDLRAQKLSVFCTGEAFQGDLTWSAEALGNVLKNAVEHTPVGGAITVTVRETALYTEIAVQDSGSGFSAADLPHLFERFYRGSDAAENSIGIGLALARTILTAQNGTIRAMNTPGGGCFLLRFYKQII